MRHDPGTVWAEAARADSRLVAGEWETPIPLIDDDLPGFPVSVLPAWWRDFAQSNAEALQTPVDLQALLVLAVVALASTKRFVVQVREDWTEPTNVYVVVTCAPGEGKSPAFKAALAPILGYQMERQETMRTVIAVEQSRRRVAEDRLKSLEKNAAARPNDPEAAMRVEEAAADVQRIGVPSVPLMVVSDATPEAVAQSLAEQGERLGVFSAEGAGPFEIMRGRYSTRSRPNLEIFLAGHSGDHVSVQRITRQGFTLTSPAITLALTVQPHVILGLGESDDLRQLGLLARCLYAVPKSLVGRRNARAAPMPAHVSDLYSASVARLLRLAEGLDRPAVLSLDASARDRIIAIKDAVEPQIGPSGDLHYMADWANKYVGTVARIAGLLHVADCIDGDSVPATIPDATLARAATIGEYLTSHAAAAFHQMGADPATVDALAVLDWIRSHPGPRVRKRDIQRARARLKDERLGPAIDLLERYGYIRRAVQEVGGVGRPPTEFLVNPLIHMTQLTEARGSVISVTRARASTAQPPDDGPLREYFEVPIAEEVST